MMKWQLFHVRLVKAMKDVHVFERIAVLFRLGTGRCVRVLHVRKHSAQQRRAAGVR